MTAQIKPFSRDVAPATQIVSLIALRPVTPAASNLTDGDCRAILMGEAGTITYMDLTGTTVSNVPLPAGVWPIGARQIISSDVAVWAGY